MSKKNESLGKTIGVVLALCLVCSILVAGSAVALKPLQEKNAALAMQRNILDAAGILEPGMDIPAVYNERINALVVSLKDYQVQQDVNPADFDNRKAAGDPDTSTRLQKSEDIAGIGTMETMTEVYLVMDENGNRDGAVLHIRGQGLWGTMYGLISLEDDLNTVRGVNFYEHSETPGLGGEITNPSWVKTWEGKELFGDDGNVKFDLVKGGASNEHQVDALSGATLTSNGVDALIDFWMSDKAYGPLLAKLRKGELTNG
ncbi:Na(+)-translocating NADH-quinone reductase subunit C [Idiomarina aquatica]|jgi:Na+-transporting NADH:ubiquinone oxidoreductase subunit C|uniref:Na(+)-translocating NADH-quinone reductase subunit C n=1 Tax=Idiomarina aquatica TaxID=1327752 RepID=A0AA94EFP0_9GAMM|nr:Na(+)-translocating NADH-quinone reductase subunit C [Idiomarina aquatica]RUO44920.1 Na(+)-translocating NADH-quinone reductase subunit C [Idiomarina aquatica]